jgi:hypothetical protein
MPQLVYHQVWQTFMSQSVNAPGYPLCLAGSIPWLVGSPGHPV